MARVKSPLMSAEVSGAVSGIEFKTGNHGSTVGLKSCTPFLRTKCQLQNRAVLHYAHTAYALLSPSSRAGWEAFADPPLTGRMTYVQSFLRLAPGGLTPYIGPGHTHQYPLPLQLYAEWLDEPNLQYYIYPSAWQPPYPLVSLFWRPTWNKATYCHPRAMKLIHSQLYNGYYISDFLPHAAPRHLLRLDCIDPNTGSLLAQIPLVLDST